jgi:hypothetical protein
MAPRGHLAVLAAALPLSAAALTLSSSLLSVTLDDGAFPRPLNYTHLSTGETMHGALTGWGFHVQLSVNGGQLTCGEAGMAVTYAPLPAPAPPGVDGRSFTVDSSCVLHWLDDASSSSSSSSSRPRARAATVVELQLGGTVSVEDDPAVAGAGIFTWTLTNATATPPVVPLNTLTVVGMELLTMRPVPEATTWPCFYKPDDNGKAPACGGDSYYVDSWGQVGLDEWWAETFDQFIVEGSVDINTPPTTNAACFDGAGSRHAPGPLLSTIGAGWSHSGHTGASVLALTQHHTPLWTGSRSYDVPGRCSVFTVSPAPIYINYLCGPGLPYSVRVGVFGDLTQDSTVSPDDVYLWRRMQFPRADVLYRSSLPYKLQVDMTAYAQQHNWVVDPFTHVLTYGRNLSFVTDSYPQTAILVGWQGIGHDTLYPAWDEIDWAAGGSAGLEALVAGWTAATGTAQSSISYHVNSDEAYARFNGSANAEFDVRICRLQVDHATAWYSNCTVTGEQIPDCGIRCSISKTKDAVLYDRYGRYSKMFSAIPNPSSLRTIHSDAWRDVGASWEPDTADGGLGFLSWEQEARCGQQADSDFWASHGASLGVEGQNGQALDFLGIVSFVYHGDGWDPAWWGRVVAGTSLGWDLDVSCVNPGWSCGWVQWTNNFYLTAKIYQLALTDELLGTDESTGYHRFARGGRVHRNHTSAAGHDWLRAMAKAGMAIGDLPTPSTWPYGGDSIPIVDGFGGVFVPLIKPDGTVDNGTVHAYQKASSAPPDPSCALFQPSPASYIASNNTALGDWNAPPFAQFELDPAMPETQAVSVCNASCWGNVTCQGWDLIKVTPTSGKTKPLCMLFANPVGCETDPNQWAGVKAPLPVPAPGAVNQTWTLPLSWVGAQLSSTALTPEGYAPGPQLVINGRSLTLVGVVPGYPVRITKM